MAHTGPRSGKSSQRQELQNDPDEVNDPRRSERGEYDAHIWQSLHQIFERLGKIDVKMDHLGSGQEDLKKTVESHDTLIKRITWGVAGVIFVGGLLWLFYNHVLKDNLVVSWRSQPVAETAQHP